MSSPLYAKTLGKVFTIQNQPGSCVGVDKLPMEVAKGWWFTFLGHWYRIISVEIIGNGANDRRATIGFECHVDPAVVEGDVLFFSSTKRGAS